MYTNFFETRSIKWQRNLFPALFVLLCSCSTDKKSPPEAPAGSFLQTDAKTVSGEYISWREHIIDDPVLGGIPISGGDGLIMVDLDLDGIEDIVSVHESDTKYDGVADGYIRIAYGSEDPDKWTLVTLAEGEEAAAPEDVSAADVNGDGFPDIIAACELAHLIYFQNPGKNIRTTRWARLIPPITKDRGSFIRVFFADFNQDGKPEVSAANKGSQAGNPANSVPTPISWYEIRGEALDPTSWVEHELTKVNVPINAEPFDLDQDGDPDIVAGSRGEQKICWFENLGQSEIAFKEHAIEISNPDSLPFGHITGFNMAYTDLSGDDRLDIITWDWRMRNLVWFEQPVDFSQPWMLHIIGDMRPDDLVGLTLADINGDGHNDLMTGSYSRGARAEDGEVSIDDALGRLSWYENPGDPDKTWERHDISRRKRGMFDKFEARDLDGDGDVDFVSTRGNSVPYDCVFWLEQVRTKEQGRAFVPARSEDSEEMGIPE